MNWRLSGTGGYVRARATRDSQPGMASRALRDAARSGHVGIVRELLAGGRADPAADESCSLRSAARRGHTDVVLALLADRRADPTAQQSLALLRPC
jgi:hypothetical protein